jgi:AAA15 family ATPase/GTPase
MLVQFTVRNFKTFRDEVKLSMVANSDDTCEKDNIIAVPAFNLRLLKSAVIYGANASGKSRLLEAMRFMDEFVQDSSKDRQINDKIKVDPFRLNTLSRKQPSSFEMVFVQANEMFRYGFEVTQDVVEAEWLYHRVNKKESELFFRKGQNFESMSSKFRTGKQLAKASMIRPNALLLSVAAQFNDETARKVLDWFSNFQVIPGLEEKGLLPFTISQLMDSIEKPKILTLLRDADVMIDDLAEKKMDVSTLPDDAPEEVKKMVREREKDGKPMYYFDVTTLHTVYDELNQPVDKAVFSMEQDESSGTAKFFALTGPIIDSLERSQIVAIDEIDAKIHPNLVCKIIGLFNSASTNPQNAQLIFNTHDTNLLSSGLFRRDQIWFTEKDRYGAASLYSLSDFKTDIVRKNDDFELKYIQGKFGAVPYLGNFGNIFEPSLSMEK